jgi:hypothetical protein
MAAVPIITTPTTGVRGGNREGDEEEEEPDDEAGDAVEGADVGHGGDLR